MSQPIRRKFDIYRELYPASSVAIIGSGLIAITLGKIFAGEYLVISGITFGIITPLARQLRYPSPRRARKKHFL